MKRASPVFHLLKNDKPNNHRSAVQHMKGPNSQAKREKLNQLHQATQRNIHDSRQRKQKNSALVVPRDPSIQPQKMASKKAAEVTGLCGYRLQLKAP
ncbi:hypothetical protein BRADI_2g45113v3 [Brachypodium distachyon]|uniref:Uncharacterized protein n=1 Tax=Brachypodium distachyon TaxID=15368 RepID=A0A0Q3KD91_BRADI|nr:hypothetical protein BRADI_2g45113v3 [Brachypodium distachyon]